MYIFKRDIQIFFKSVVRCYGQNLSSFSLAQSRVEYIVLPFVNEEDCSVVMDNTFGWSLGVNYSRMRMLSEIHQAHLA